MMERSQEKNVIKQCISNGINISFEDRGSGEPLILLMGLGAPGAKWEPHIKEYEKYFRVIAIDNRGSGLSDKPVSYAYSIKDMAKDTIGVMDFLGIKFAHVNGISMGGAIAQYLAIHYADRIGSLILTNTFPYCCVSFRRAIEFLRDICGQIDPVSWGRLCQWIIFAQSFQEKNESYLLKSELEDMNYPYPMPAYAYKAQCNAILGHNVIDKLPYVKAPTLIIGGDEDLFVPVSVTLKMKDAIPNSKLYIAKNGGHVQHWEQLEAYNQVTLDFLLKH